MKFTLTAITALFLASAALSAATGARTTNGEVEAKIEAARGLEPLTANTPRTDGGDTAAQNPDNFVGLTEVPYEWMFPGGQLHPNSTEGTMDARDLTIRNPGDLYCCPVAGWGWKAGNQLFLRDQIDWLRHRGACNVNPHTCSRVSCANHTAVWVCNDRFYIIGPPCAEIGDYAQELSNRCSKDGWTCGQKFDNSEGTFNIIVRTDAC